MRNTTKLVEENPSIFLTKALMVGPEKAITDMEAEGQKDFLNSDVLPVTCQNAWRVEKDPDFYLREMGFNLGDVLDGDDIFRTAHLPPGWTKVGCDHVMHSNILDAAGNVRIGVFYKAAHYDRRCSYSFSTAVYVVRRKEEGRHYLVVMGPRDQILYRTEKYVAKEICTHEEYDALHGEAHAWRDAHYPEADSNPLAYWEDFT